VNTGAPWPTLEQAWPRVRHLQHKLHRWAAADPDRRFDDLHNLVGDPAFLVVAWDRVRANKGARTAGVDGLAPRAVGTAAGRLLEGLRADLKARRFTPVPVREKLIPKASGKLRRLGIPTAADRVVQAALKLVLEPIFEADFKPCSYGFRPRRRAQDAIAEGTRPWSPVAERPRPERSRALGTWYDPRRMPASSPGRTSPAGPAAKVRVKTLTSG
jgi:RNA-directed DNA polymerase